MQETACATRNAHDRRAELARSQTDARQHISDEYSCSGMQVYGGDEWAINTRRNEGPLMLPGVCGIPPPSYPHPCFRPEPDHVSSPTSISPAGTTSPVGKTPRCAREYSPAPLFARACLHENRGRGPSRRQFNTLFRTPSTCPRGASQNQVRRGRSRRRIVSELRRGGLLGFVHAV